MPKTGRIDEMFNIPAIEKQVQQTNELLGSTLKKMMEIAEYTAKIKMDLAGVTSSKDLNKNLAAISAENKKASEENARLNKILTQQAILEEKLATAKSAAAAQEAKSTAAKTAAALAEEKLAAAKKATALAEERLTAARQRAASAAGSKNENSMLAETARLEKKLADLKSEEAKRTFELKEQVNLLTAKRRNEVESVKGVKDSIDAMRKTVNLLTQEYDHMIKAERGSASGIALQSRIKGLNDEIRQSKVAIGDWKANVGNYLSGLYNQVTGFIAAASGTIYMVKKWIMTNADLSDSMAAVRRTTGMTNAEVYKLNENLRSLDTRTSQASLLDLAHVAGKLGIAKDEILGFVKAADMIGVALGKDIGNNEEAINQLGRIVSLFKVNADGVGMEKALLKVGSALKDLGNASVAEEVNIIDFTKRLGGIAPIAGVSVDKIMALGATYDILGQTMEVSSTATSQMWIGMAQKTEKFAKIAGMSVKDFSALMKKDFNEAFIAVITGMTKSNGGINELASYFKDLGLDGRRIIGVMAALSDKIGVYRQQMEISKKSLDEAKTATEQYKIQNETLGASIDKLSKSFVNMMANSGTLSALTSMANGMAWAFEKASKYAGTLFAFVSGGLSSGIISGVFDIFKSGPKQTEQPKWIQDKIAEIEKMREANRKAIDELKKGDGTWMTGMSKEQLKAMKQIEEAFKRLERQSNASQKRQDALTKQGDAAIEKSFQLRTELGLVSLQEQEQHEKEMLDNRITDINNAATEEMKNKANIDAQLNKWTKERLDKELKMIEDNATQQIITHAQAEEMKFAITVKYQKKQAEINQQRIKEEQDILKSQIESVNNRYDIAKMSDITKFSGKRNDELTALAEQLDQKNITVEDYKKREQEINNKYDQLILESSIAILEEQIAKLKDLGKDTLDLEQKLAEARIALDAKATKAILDNAEEAAKKKKKQIEDVILIMQTMGSMAGEILSGFAQNDQYNQEQATKKMEARYQAEYDALDEAVKHKTMSESEAARQKTALEKKQREESDRLDKQYRERQRERDIIQATIQTALAVITQLVREDWIGAAAAAALGITQIAIISAQKYAKGRKGGPDEFAWVGEEGTEGIRLKSGQMFQTPPTATLTHLPEGADVIPHEEWMQTAARFSTPTMTGQGNKYHVTVSDPYGKEMLSEMRRKKTDTRIIDMGNYVVEETGNYRLFTRK